MMYYTRFNYKKAYKRTLGEVGWKLGVFWRSKESVDYWYDKYEPIEDEL